MDLDSRLGRAVVAALTDDLRRAPWRGLADRLAGHCYVASEAMYHATGGRNGPWTPCSVRHEGTVHWYLRDAQGRVCDLTAGQFRTSVPYDQGRCRGFLTRGPSKRAQVVLEKVLETGVDARGIRGMMAFVNGRGNPARDAGKAPTAGPG
jgi:hypothetical protein